MRTLVVYDSTYGNTEKIARAIGEGAGGEVKVINATRINLSALEPFDFLFIGSPTQGGRPTPAVKSFIDNLPDSSAKNISVAAFDTRFSTKWVGVFGYAAGRIAESLKSKGAKLAVSPEPFFVAGKEGPLKDGELERAAEWAKTAVQNAIAARA